MNNYWLIPMDFDRFNFNQLSNEYKNKKCIMWEINVKPNFYKKTNEYKRNEKNPRVTSIKKDDVIYFMISGLPTAYSNKKISRILLRGVVASEPIPMKKGEIFRTPKDDVVIEKSEKESYVKEDEWVHGFAINNITTLAINKLKDNRVFEKSSILKQYNCVEPRSSTWPNTINSQLSRELVEKLEMEFTNETINDLISYVSQKCYFYDKTQSKKYHETFMRRNGTNYYELHHFIPKKVSRKNIELKELVDDPRNLITLCPTCHEKIHRGTNEDVIEMIREIMKIDDIKNMLIDYKNLINVKKGEKDCLLWIMSLYI